MGNTTPILFFCVERNEFWILHFVQKSSIAGNVICGNSALSDDSTGLKIFSEK